MRDRIRARIAATAAAILALTAPGPGLPARAADTPGSAPSPAPAALRSGTSPAERGAFLSAPRNSQAAAASSLAVTPLSGGTPTADDLARRIMGGRGEIPNAVFTGSPDAAGKVPRRP